MAEVDDGPGTPTAVGDGPGARTNAGFPDVGLQAPNSSLLSAGCRTGLHMRDAGELGCNPSTSEALAATTGVLPSILDARDDQGRGFIGVTALPRRRACTEANKLLLPTVPESDTLAISISPSLACDCGNC